MRNIKKIFLSLLLIIFSSELNPKYVKNQLLLMPYPQSVSANFGSKESIEISPNISLLIENNGLSFLNTENDFNEACNDTCKDFLNDNFNFSITETLKNQEGLKDFRLSLHKQLDLDQIIPEIKSTISQVKVKLTDKNIFPKLDIGINEKYSLSISTSEILITAGTVYGIRHGFETLAQLIRIYEKKFVISQLPIQIEDFPRFKWRGLLVDPVRNTFEPSMFYRIVDALAMLKNNIIHIHLSDGQQFLFESTKYEKLSEKACSDKTKIFTKEFIKKLVDYGKRRGVIIYGEIDIPAHSASWGLGYPGLVANCWKHIVDKKSNYGENIPALNPVYNDTEDIIKTLVTELGEAFEYNYVHIGGDEVSSTAWAKADELPQIEEFMSQHGFKEYIEIEGYLTKIAQKQIKDNKKIPIVFEELYQHGYADNNSIIHVWNSELLFNEVLEKNYSIIISAPYYVDKQMPLCKDYDTKSCEVTHNRFSWTYQDFYSFEPENKIEPQLMKGVLGFEGCSWNESCDRQNFFNRVFQRYFTIAERMWSSKKMNENYSAEIRGSYFRCLSLRRKIYDGAGPISPSLCDIHE